MANPLSSMMQYWLQLSVNQKTALIVGLLVVGIASGIAIHIFSAPRYALLFGNLAGSDANAVVEKLKERQILYKLEQNGTSILIPAELVDETRMALVAENIPQGGATGFEIFDKTSIGQSSFAEKLNFQRGLQGELQRTIGSLDKVQSCRVHLVIPQAALYLEEKKPTTASVFLDLRGALEPKEVRAIVHLVSRAVEGLEPANVTVVDKQGNLLSEQMNAFSENGDANRMQAQRSLESEMEKKVQSMLDQTLGPKKAIVRASARINFDRKRVEKETYTPVQGADASPNGPTTGVLENEHVTREVYDGSPASATGSPGMAPNLGLDMGAGGNGKGRKYQRDDTTSSYRVSKEVESVEITPGQVERMNLAVLVDASVPKEQLTALEPTIAAAANLDSTRGDKIVVQAIPFDTSAAQASEKAELAESKSAMLWNGITWGAAGLAGVVFLVVLIAMYRMTLSPVTQAQVLPAHALDSMGTLPDAPYQMLANAERAIEHYAALETPPELVDDPTGDPDELPISQLEPARIAKVIKGLLAEDG